MANEVTSSAPVPNSPWARQAAGLGLALAAAGAVVCQVAAAGTRFDPYPADAGNGLLIAALGSMALGLVGCLIGGWAITRRPNDPTTLALGGVTAATTYFAAHPDWDSMRLLFGVLAGVAWVAALLMAVPRNVRWGLVTAAIVFHYCGILSAITSPPPTPWLTSQLWVRVFRPHLEFCYVNNAYQFYSPEPGPANVLWFCIFGEDGQPRWLKIPEGRSKLDPLQIEYFRRLSLTERVNSNENLPMGPPPDVAQRRASMAVVYPFHPEAMPGQQYRMPDENSRQFLASYIRHVARTYGTGRVDDKGQPVKVKAIKVYLVQHRMMTQLQCSKGHDPYAPDTYLPFFLGEFDATGRLVDPLDPMLYWIVPILREPKPRGPDGKDFEIKNYILLHAGSDPFAGPIAPRSRIEDGQ